jgi:hypothetical protein
MPVSKELLNINPQLLQKASVISFRGIEIAFSYDLIVTILWTGAFFTTKNSLISGL